MTSSLSAHTRALIKSSIPALEAHGVTITTEMYKRLFTHPEIRSLFTQSRQNNGEQPKALALSILAYARHIDDPSPLTKMLQRIAQKHVSLNILPEHYSYVGEALLEAIAHVLGSNATNDIMEAWKEAYLFLADILIAQEATLYHQNAEHT